MSKNSNNLSEKQKKNDKKVIKCIIWYIILFYGFLLVTPFVIIYFIAKVLNVF